MQQKEGDSSDLELKQHGIDAPTQQHEDDSSQELNSLRLQHIHAKDAYQLPRAEQNTLHAFEVLNLKRSEKNPENLDSRHLNLQGLSNQQSMQSFPTGTSGQQLMAAKTSYQPKSATDLSSQPAIDVVNQGKQVPFSILIPHIQRQLDKDRAMHLQTLYLKLRKNEISKEGFIRHMRSIIGEQMLKMAVYKFQSQAARNDQAVPQSQASPQQHQQNRTDDSSNLAGDSNAKKLHEVENQADLHGTPGSQISSSSLFAVKQERDCSAFPVKGLNKQQQQHLHFSQASFPKFANIGDTYSPYSVTNVSSSMGTPVKQPSNDIQIRQIPAYPNRNATPLRASTHAVNMINAPKLERQNSFGEPKRIPGGSLSHVSNTSTMQQSSLQWSRSTNKEQKILLSTPMTNLKPEPIDHLHDQGHESQLASFTSVQVEQGNSSSVSSKDEAFKVQTSRMGISTTTSIKPSNLLSLSVSSQMDTITLLNSRTPSVISPIGPANNGKIPLKMPTIGQKKPLVTQGFSPPPSGKKQKVSGAFSDQSIEQLNDVTAVSGVNLKEEEEQLFSGPKEDSRLSEASHQAVREEEERLILQKIPLQKKLTGIMAKCGLKNMSSDVERCLSLCVEERMLGLMSSLIRLSKQDLCQNYEMEYHLFLQRVNIEKSRHRTIVTSDVGQQIMLMNRKVREEWEKKQAEAEKLQVANEPEDDIGDDGDKEKDAGCIRSMKGNKEEDDKLRTTAANVAARAAVGGDDMMSKWQLMAEQARQKREGALDVVSHSQPGAVRRVGKSQVALHARVPRNITVKDVIAVLEREAQMFKSTLIYRFHEKMRSDAPAELVNNSAY
ncbi:PREDICTED: transcription initiation factor TFIID subunit 4b-like isoform X3 [Nicotiana attenuata]|uniref:transcription initiation factor TFIID subunit 4b-like isoform X3 n=1 Tax=Nicotiana attenuata TaxID=49451 RepID=UPI000904DE56|nr:PREDICTED: transcription initiation factor TFIID subunit 4b-like isoform X3 [Nicotiana attenuata]